MLTPEQLKGRIRNLAKEKGLSSQEVLQMYLFEHVLARLAKSPYKDNFILKGGFLIASMIGVNERKSIVGELSERVCFFAEYQLRRYHRVHNRDQVDTGFATKMRLVLILDLRQ